MSFILLHLEKSPRVFFIIFHSPEEYLKVGTAVFFLPVLSFCASPSL